MTLDWDEAPHQLASAMVCLAVVAMTLAALANPFGVTRAVLLGLCRVVVTGDWRRVLDSGVFGYLIVCPSYPSSLFDWRTPIGQSGEFYFALKARKIDNVLVRVPNRRKRIGFGECFRRIGWGRWSIFWDGWRSIRSRGYRMARTARPSMPLKSVSRVTRVAPRARAVAAIHRSFSSMDRPLVWRMNLSAAYWSPTG